MRDSDFLRAAASTIRDSSDTWAVLTEACTDRGVDVDADDVMRLLDEAAERLDGDQ